MSIAAVPSPQGWKQDPQPSFCCTQQRVLSYSRSEGQGKAADPQASLGNEEPRPSVTSRRGLERCRRSAVRRAGTDFGWHLLFTWLEFVWLEAVILNSYYLYSKQRKLTLRHRHLDSFNGINDGLENEAGGSMGGGRGSWAGSENFKRRPSGHAWVHLYPTVPSPAT